MNGLRSLAETRASALAIALLYCLYVPFGVCRALFGKDMITTFFQDALYVMSATKEAIFKRLKK